jgi:glycyl-tRNA synthetase
MQSMVNFIKMERMIRVEKLKNVAKDRGFIFPGSDIYEGLQSTYDYGPLGVELKNNIKKAWWKVFVQRNIHNVGLDASILMNPKVWEASGHIQNFTDPLMDCKECKTRHRADKLIEEKLDIIADGLSFSKMEEIIKDEKIVCPDCGKQNFTEIRQFNLMFKTHQGVTEKSSDALFLRPETAQGIFVNFENVLRTTRKKLPFGIGQIGKSFRNEITPGNFTFRMREFEQMELEFFCKPGEDMKWFDYWVETCHQWLINLGIKEENVRLRPHSKEELSHYSLATTDIEFKFPFGWGELWGIANRTDYDLKQHMERSGKDLRYRDPVTNEVFLPFCIEPSLGADRVTLAFLANAYHEEEVVNGDKKEMRTILKFHPAIAPYKAAILPLQKKYNDKVLEIYQNVSEEFVIDTDITSVSIGKKYRRQDEIGTPFCFTYDNQSEIDGTVTVRDRDTMEQERIDIKDIENYLREKTRI